MLSKEKINEEESVLIALAAAKGERYSPVQLQKMIFLMQQYVGNLIGKPFDFKPYDYGPFDAGVYRVAESLANRGFANIDCSKANSARKYSITEVGKAEAQLISQGIPTHALAYLEELSCWVRSQSFGNLVSAVYKFFPEMKANSIFKG